MKIFREVHIHNLLSQVKMEEISFSRMVEILNETTVELFDKQESVSQMKLVETLDVYLSQKNANSELRQQAYELKVKLSLDISAACEKILNKKKPDVSDI